MAAWLVSKIISVLCRLLCFWQDGYVRQSLYEIQLTVYVLMSSIGDPNWRAIFPHESPVFFSNEHQPPSEQAMLRRTESQAEGIIEKRSVVL